MKARPAIGLAVLTIASGLTVWRGGLVSSARAGGDGISAVVAVVGLPATADDYEYVGSSKCKKCHVKQHRSWKKSKMAKALDTLKPGKAVEAKKKHNLDPRKDYTQDTSCLACHTTGHTHPGGYVIPDPSDKKAVRRAKKLAGVGCESCHGPGSAYNKVFEEIFKSKRKYKVEELYAAGLVKVDATTCTKCHNQNSPTIDANEPFDFEAKKTEDAHENHPLKQREG